MPTLVANCPRCGAKIHTFDIHSINPISADEGEAFSVCRCCNQGVIFIVSARNRGRNLRDVGALIELVRSNNNLNDEYFVVRHIDISDTNSAAPPEHLPKQINDVFMEAARCHSIGCWNAAGAMFRASVDIATKDILPTKGPKEIHRKYLARRLEWLFHEKKIPENLRELSTCIREDGNDAVHDASLTEADANDLLEFADALLTSIYTQPEQIKLKLKEREKRRENKSKVKT